MTNRSLQLCDFGMNRTNVPIQRLGELEDDLDLSVFGLTDSWINALVSHTIGHEVRKSEDSALRPR